ncbi:hypothetical protein BLA29_013583, partial [Euroglyphus maynei]
MMYILNVLFVHHHGHMKYDGILKVVNYKQIQVPYYKKYAVNNVVNIHVRQLIPKVMVKVMPYIFVYNIHQSVKL